MKKISVIICLLMSALCFFSCGGSPQDAETGEAGGSSESVELTLWTFPVGNWDNPTAVSNMLAGFHKEYPNIRVSVERLDYDTGDDAIAEAASKGSLPDLVLEGPERLVATWGERGWMADLSDLWESYKADRIYETVKEACRHKNGDYYEFPICMTAHCMAINYDLFEKAGALPYIDEENHTWSTENFIKAVRALNAYGQKNVGVVYCKNQSGDQGTRALVNNLYGGTFTNKDHTAYTVDSEKNKKALQLLYDLEGITFEPSFTSADAIDGFCKKESAMCFCWNASLEVQQTITSPDLDFEVFPMAFPSSRKTPELQGGIWGFGVFNTGNQERIEAAKTFIRYFTENDTAYTRAVLASSYWPVRDMESNLYENDAVMTEHSIFLTYMGDYYQVTPQWAEARAAWWKMLAEIGEGTDVSKAVKGFPAE